jgi:hypothetical protein
MYVKKSKKTGKSKNSKTNSKFSKSISEVNQKATRPGLLPLSPIPEKVISTIGYTFIGNPLDTVTNDFNFVRFKLNSPYDCGLALSSNDAEQYFPYGDFYQSFAVVSSSIDVQLVNTDNDVPLRITVLPSLDNYADVPAWTTDRYANTSPYAKSIVLGNANGMDKSRISMVCDVGKLAGVGVVTPNTYEYIGDTVGSHGGQLDPIISGSWIITAQALASITDNINCLLSINISYKVMYWNRVSGFQDQPTVSTVILSAKDKHLLYAEYAQRQSMMKQSKPVIITKEMAPKQSLINNYIKKH